MKKNHDYEIVLATEEETWEVNSFLYQVDMGLSGDIKEHVLLKKDEELLAVAKFTPIKSDEYHLDIMAVRKDQQGKGLGKILLSELLRAPWQCFDNYGPVDNYVVTTMARGTAVPFYAKFGFKPCKIQDIHWVYVDQCKECPVLEECKPEPLIFKSQQK